MGMNWNSNYYDNGYYGSGYSYPGADPEQQYLQDTLLDYLYARQLRRYPEYLPDYYGYPGNRQGYAPGLEDYYRYPDYAPDWGGYSHERGMYERGMNDYPLFQNGPENQANLQRFPFGQVYQDASRYSNGQNRAFGTERTDGINAFRQIGEGNIAQAGNARESMVEQQAGNETGFNALKGSNNRDGSIVSFQQGANNRFEGANDRTVASVQESAATEGGSNSFQGSQNHAASQDFKQTASDKALNIAEARQAARTVGGQQAGDEGQNVLTGSNIAGSRLNATQEVGAQGGNTVVTGNSRKSDLVQNGGAGARQLIEGSKDNRADEAFKQTVSEGQNSILAGKGATTALQTGDESLHEIDASQGRGLLKAVQSGDGGSKRVIGGNQNSTLVAEGNESSMDYSLGSKADKVAVAGEGNSGAIQTGSGADEVHIKNANQNGLVIDGGEGDKDSAIFDRSADQYDIQDNRGVFGKLFGRKPSYTINEKGSDTAGTSLQNFEQFRFGNKSYTPAELNAWLKQQNAPVEQEPAPKIAPPATEEDPSVRRVSAPGSSV